MRNKTAIQLLTPLVVAALALTACGTDSTQPDTDTAPSDDADTALADDTDTAPSDDADTASSDAFEPRGFCLSENLYLSGIWLDDPVFGELRAVEFEYPDGSVTVSNVVDVTSSAGDLRSPSALQEPVSDASLPRKFSAALAAAPTSDGPDSAFFISNALGFHFGGLIDIAGDRILTWTGCEEEWTDQTDLLTEWAGTDDPREVIDVLKGLVRQSRYDEGSDFRASETERMWDLAMGVDTTPVAAWGDRPSHSRSLVDADTPVDITERLDAILIGIEGVEPVGDPDLVICPVQATATSGYCFSIDALANAAEGSVIRIALLRDEPLEFLLGRESRWAEPGHEVNLGSVDGQSDAINLTVLGRAQEEGSELDRVLETVQINFEPIARELVDIEGGDYLGGTEPYEGN